MASRSLEGEIPQIPHLVSDGKKGIPGEVRDLRRDMDAGFVSIEAEIDAITGADPDVAGPKMSVTDVLTSATVTALIGQTVLVDPTDNPIAVDLPEVVLADKGRQIEIKVALGASPGTLLSNLVQVRAYAGNTIDGLATFSILMQRGAIVLRNDGVSGWAIVSAYLPPVPFTLPDALQTDHIAVGSDGQTGFALSTTPLDPDDAKMTVNGSDQKNGLDFIVTGSAVEWQDVAFTLETGDSVTFTYQF